MSGVVKDDSKPKPEAEADGAETGATESAAMEPGPEVVMSQDDTDTQIRKPTSHLRVVTESEEAAGAEGVVTLEEAETDLNEVPTRIDDEPEPALPPLFPTAQDDRVEPVDLDAEDAPKVRIGVAIREQREGLGWSLEKVSKDLKLHVSVLTAIEQMNPSALGPRVYAIGHIRDYARHLNMDPGKTLTRYKAECAILADPVKKQISPPKAERKGKSSAAPAFGLLLAGLAAAGGAVYLFNGSDGGSARSASQPAAASLPAAEPGVTAAATQIAAPTQTLRILATKRARVEFRGADGTKFLARYFSPGESYAPRVGAGWTVTTNEGDAFEWRLGDMTLGQLSEDGGPVYAQSVDGALSREAKPIEIADQPTTEFAPAPVVAAPVETPAAEVAPPPRRAAPARTPPRATAPAPEPEPAATVDPSLLAYPE